MVMSGGTEGGLSPHFLVFTATPAARNTAPTQSGASAPPSPARSARRKSAASPQIEATAEAVTAAMRQAGITRTEDVHYVQVKCPLLTGERIADATARGQTVATADTYKSMGYSRGASALGVALALKEIDPAGCARRQRRLPPARPVVRTRQHLRRDRADAQ